MWFTASVPASATEFTPGVLRDVVERRVPPERRGDGADVGDARQQHRHPGNSQCAILAATTVTAGGSTLTLNLQVTFKSALPGSSGLP
mgnify:CR=1 FL=1